jgi:hypothetical protein
MMNNFNDECKMMNFLKMMNKKTMSTLRYSSFIILHSSLILLLNLTESHAQKVPTFQVLSLSGRVREGLFSLNGKWQYIIDPYETGFYDYRYMERGAKDKDAYWNSDVPSNPTEKIEHGYSDKNTLNVPSDWNSQAEKFLYYEGTVWYKKSFNFDRLNERKIN